MRVINKTKNIILAEDAVIADTAFSRLRGLLGKEDLPSGRALIIKPCSSIHTFFMRFAIDAIFVSRSYRILKCYHNLRPWRLSRLFFSAGFCVELPAGCLLSKNTQENDLIEIA